MNSKKEVQHVYLVGAKSLGAYGGYETFVYKLTEYHQNKENIKYHVACKANGDGCMDESKFDGVTKINDHEFEFHNAHCFKIDVPQIGPAQAIYYDVAALKACCEHIKKNHIPHPIVYIMACRIGPFASHFYREIHKLGGTVYLNPDGHEWMRAKWSAPIRKYWKISEQMMVKYCDLAICDSMNIEKYIHECYDGKGIKGRNPKTTFIAYGADLTLSKLADDDEKLMNWYLRDPAIVIRKDSITFNTACITGLEDVVYVHVMFNNDLKRIVVRGCDENDKDALRWCVAKPDKRKSRKMSCKPFATLVYQKMGWDSECRYKMLGYRITFEGETLYVFDLLVPEIFHEGQRKKNAVDSQDNAASTKPVNSRKGFYLDDIVGTFGVPVEEHRKESEVKQMDGYVSMGILTGKIAPEAGKD